MKTESKKRKPLADITNTYNLIPTSALRDLVDASSNANSLSRPPSSILKSISSSTDQTLCSDKSDPRFGSSNVISARSSRSVRFRTPPHGLSLISTRGISGIRDIANTRRQTIGTNKKGAGEVLIGNPTLTEKREDKGKAIDVPYNLLPHESDAAEKRKDKGKAVAAPFSSQPGVSKSDAVTFSPTPVEKGKDKGKTVGVPFSSASHVCEADTVTFSLTPVERRNDKGKGIAVDCSSPPPVSETEILSFSLALDGKEKDKVMGVAVPCSSASHVSEVDVFPDVRRKDKGKGIAVACSLPPPVSEAEIPSFSLALDGKEKDKRKGVAVTCGSSSRVSDFDVFSDLRRKDKGKAIFVPFTSSLHESEADVQIGTPTPVEKGKEKGKAIDLPLSSSSLESEDDFLILSSNAAEKVKYKGKSIAELFNSSTPDVVGDYQNAVSSSYTPLVRNVQPNETNPFSVSFDEIMDDPSPKILKSYIRVNKKIEKEKVVSNLFGSSVGKQKQKEKGTTSQSSHSIESKNDGTKRVTRLSVSSIKKKKGGQQNLSVSLLEKTKDKWKATPQPSCKIEIAEHKGASHTVERRYPQRKSRRGKSDVGVSSCPPLKKAGNLWNILDDVEDNKSISWTDPHPKRRKTRQSRNEQTSELPQDFIEQQKAYFKEVDGFELPEEEISQDDLE